MTAANDDGAMQKAVNDDELYALKVWVLKAIRYDVKESKLKGSYFVDTDAYSFVKYVAALLKQDKPFEELKELCVRNLKLFTQQDTQRFVDHLFSALQGKHFLKIQQDPEYNELHNFVLMKENRVEELPATADDNKPSHSGAEFGGANESGGVSTGRLSSPPHPAHVRRSNSRSRSRSGSRERLSIRDRLGWRRSRERGGGSDDGNDASTAAGGGENRDGRQTINNRRRDNNNRDYNNNARRHQRDGGYDSNRDGRRDCNTSNNIRSLQSTVTIVGSQGSAADDGRKTNDNIVSATQVQPISHAVSSQQHSAGPNQPKQRCRDFEAPLSVQQQKQPLGAVSTSNLPGLRGSGSVFGQPVLDLSTLQPGQQQQQSAPASMGIPATSVPATGIAITIGNVPQQPGIITPNAAGQQTQPTIMQLGSSVQALPANVMNSTAAFQPHNAAIQQQQQRPVGGVFLSNPTQAMQNIQAGMPINSMMQQQQQLLRPSNIMPNVMTPVGMMTVHYQQQQQPMMQQHGHFMHQQRPLHANNNMRRFSQHGYQPRAIRPMTPQQHHHHQNFGSGVVNPCAIELRKIPRENNNVLKLSEHFSKYGNIVNIKLHYDNDESAALLEFEKPDEACAAFQSPEPIMQNRFIRIFWLRDRSQPVQQALGLIGGADQAGGRVSAKNRLGNRVSAKDRLGNNSAGTLNASPRDISVVSSSAAAASGGRKRQLDKDADEESNEPSNSVLRIDDDNNNKTSGAGNNDADNDVTDRDELVVSPTPEQEERNAKATSSSSASSQPKTGGAAVSAAGFLPNMTIRVGGDASATSSSSSTSTAIKPPQRGVVANRRTNFCRGGAGGGTVRPSAYGGGDSSYGEYHHGGPPASFCSQYYYVPTIDEVRQEHEVKQQQLNDFDTAIATKEAHLEQENALFTTIIHQFKGCRVKLQQQMLEETRVELLEMQQRTKESLDECSRRKDALQQEIDQIRKRKEWSLQELSYLTVQEEMQQEVLNYEEETGQLRLQIAAAEAAGGDASNEISSVIEQVKEKEVALHHLHSKLQKHMYAKGKMHRLVQEVARNMALGRRIEGPRGGGAVGGGIRGGGARGGRGGPPGAPVGGGRSLYRKVNVGAAAAVSAAGPDSSPAGSGVGAPSGSNVTQHYQHLLHHQQQQQQQLLHAQNNNSSNNSCYNNNNSLHHMSIIVNLRRS